MDLNERLDEHLNKKYVNSYTSKVNDWILFYALNDLAHILSRNIEKHLKNMKSRGYVENLAKFPQLAEKLKVKFQ